MTSKSCCTSKKIINGINMLQYISVPGHSAHSDSSCVLYCVYSLEVKQTGQGCFQVSISSFLFSAESPQAGGQRYTRRESMTHIHRLLTHLAHLYSRNRQTNKNMVLVFGGGIDGPYRSLLSTVCPSYYCLYLMKLPISTASKKRSCIRSSTCKKHS